MFSFAKPAGTEDKSRPLKIEELETAIEKNREQKQVLTNLMASGYLQPALLNKESNELAAEAETLWKEKDGLMCSVNGDMVKIEELQRLLRNKKYLGDDYYPAIIDKETFDKAEEMRMSRAKALGRVWELEEKKDILFPTNFTMPAVKKVSDDPFEQAAYAYSLIESEVDGDGTK